MRYELNLSDEQLFEFVLVYIRISAIPNSLYPSERTSMIQQTHCIEMTSALASTVLL